MSTRALPSPRHDDCSSSGAGMTADIGTVDMPCGVQPIRARLYAWTVSPHDDLGVYGRGRSVLSSSSGGSETHGLVETVAGHLAARGPDDITCALAQRRARALTLTRHQFRAPSDPAEAHAQRVATGRCVCGMFGRRVNRPVVRGGMALWPRGYVL